MMFALTPEMILEMSGFDIRTWILPKKLANPALWRLLTEMRLGKARKPHRSTLYQIESLIESKLPEGVSFAELKKIPDGLPWAVSISALNMVFEMTGDVPSRVLAAEAIRLEKLASVAKEKIAHGDLHAAMEDIRHAHMPSTPCFDLAIRQIECDGSKECFAASAAPLFAATTLYLIACFEADLFSPQEEILARFLPETRGDMLVRPMRRYLEIFKMRHQLRSTQDIAQKLLPDLDPEASRREIRRWWTKGEIPARSRVDTIAKALSNRGLSNESDDFRSALIRVRLMNGMLELSLKINRHLPSFNALAPFQDYPAMLSHARSVRERLPA